MGSVTWCRPCRALAKPYLALAEHFAPSSLEARDGVVFAKLYGNASDDSKALFRDRLKVRVTPTFFVFGAAKPGEPTTVLHSHTGANKAKLEHAVREAIAAQGGDVGGIPPLYPPERKATGGWRGESFFWGGGGVERRRESKKVPPSLFIVLVFHFFSFHR